MPMNRFFSKIYKYLNTLREVQNNETLEQVNEKNNQYSNISHIVTREKIRFIQIPNIKARLELTDALNERGKWYIRGNKAHIYVKDHSNNLLIYLDQTWRTTLDIRHLEAGDLVFLLSSRSSYIFRVDQIFNDIEKYNITRDETGTPRLTVFVEDDKGFKIFLATLINSTKR